MNDSMNDATETETETETETVTPPLRTVSGGRTATMPHAMMRAVAVALAELNAFGYDNAVDTIKVAQRIEPHTGGFALKRPAKAAHRERIRKALEKLVTRGLAYRTLPPAVRQRNRVAIRYWMTEEQYADALKLGGGGAS